MGRRDFLKMFGQGVAVGLTANIPTKVIFDLGKNAHKYKRTLKDGWTVELQEDLVHMHQIDLNEIAEVMSKEMLAEINREIIRTIYTHVH